MAKKKKKRPLGRHRETPYPRILYRRVIQTVVALSAAAERTYRKEGYR